jgi:hypothetical protein
MTQDYKRHQSFPLRICPSIRQQASDLAYLDGISLNHFISLAITEKIVRMEKTITKESPPAPQRLSPVRHSSHFDKLT